jgi:hypothetical protein
MQAIAIAIALAVLLASMLYYRICTIMSDRREDKKRIDKLRERGW